MEYDEASRCFLVRAVHRTEPEVVERLAGVRIHLDETLVGRAARERRPIAVTDLAATELDPHPQILFDAGWRSLVAVPMLREGRIVGSLIVRRKRPGDFAAETFDLLETFASQSVLALTNAQLYRELQEQSAALEVASRHKSEFLASMSHELRTPLNAVLGLLRGAARADVRRASTSARRSTSATSTAPGKHLLELLNEILDLSKVEAGRMELEYSAFELRVRCSRRPPRCCASARRRTARPRASRSPTASVTSTPTSCGSSRSLLNLLTNAVKFTGAGGVRGRARRRAAAPSSTSRSPTPASASRRRTGERIFESFQQGGRGGSREEGTGLGLTLSRRLVELLGGRMWLDSEVGVGSTFTFSLPGRDTRERLERRASPRATSRRGRRHRGRPGLARPVHRLPLRVPR